MYTIYIHIYIIYYSICTYIHMCYCRDDQFFSQPINSSKVIMVNSALSYPHVTLMYIHTSICRYVHISIFVRKNTRLNKQYVVYCTKLVYCLSVGWACIHMYKYVRMSYILRCVIIQNHNHTYECVIIRLIKNRITLKATFTAFALLYFFAMTSDAATVFI